MYKKLSLHVFLIIVQPDFALTVFWMSSWFKSQSYGTWDMGVMS